jgi:glucosylceramidase
MFTQRRTSLNLVLPSLLLFLSSPFMGMAWGQEVKIFVTSKAGDRLNPKPAMKFQKDHPYVEWVFRINDGVEFQKMAGFGASFLEAGMVCLNSLEAAEQEKVLEALFDPQRGAGFSAMKTVIAGTDFMSAGPWYTYNDTPGDVTMKHFSISRDLGPNGLIPYIKRARKYGQFVLQAPMDYPPDWMLFNVNHNQDVDPRYFNALALYYLKFLREYDKNGIFIDYLSLFNEPGIYTKIPYEKIRDLIKNQVGPLFEKEGIKTRLQLCEANTRGNASKNFPAVLDDPAARKYVSAMAYHGYDYADYDKLTLLGQKYPELPLWMTEVCHAYLTDTPRSVALPRMDYEDGDFWGEQIFQDIEAGAAAWIYWNMILDEKGGPWLFSPIHGNPDQNGQHPVVIIDRAGKKVTYTALYYYLAHFSKFVRPGAVLVETVGALKDVRCLTFKQPDESFVSQFLNRRQEPVQAALVRGERALMLPLPALSITTCLWKE